MRFVRGLLLAAIVPALTMGAREASAFGDLDRPHGKTLACYAKRSEEPRYDVVTRKVMVQPAWSEVRRTRPAYELREERFVVEPARTVWLTAEPVYRTVMKDVVVRPASVQWVRKRRHLLDREEVVCKVAVPAEVRRVPVSVRVDAGKRVKRELPAVYGTRYRRVLVREGSTEVIAHPAVYRTVRERVLVRPGRVHWVKLKGCDRS